MSKEYSYLLVHDHELTRADLAVAADRLERGGFVTRDGVLSVDELLAMRTVDVWLDGTDVWAGGIRVDLRVSDDHHELEAAVIAPWFSDDGSGFVEEGTYRQRDRLDEALRTALVEIADSIGARRAYVTNEYEKEVVACAILGDDAFLRTPTPSRVEPPLLLGLTYLAREIADALDLERLDAAATTTEREDAVVLAFGERPWLVDRGALVRANAAIR